MACLCKPCRSLRICALEREVSAQRGSISSSGIRFGSRREFQFSIVDTGARRNISRGRERVWYFRSDRQWLGVDQYPLRAVRRLSAVSVLSRLFGRFLRWKAFRVEGRIAENG